MDLIIVCLYIRALFFAILIIWFLYQILRKKRWVRWERAARDMKDFIKRNEKKINTISKVIVGIFLIPSFLETTVPAVTDLPNVINKNYLQSEGIVTSWDYSDENKNEIRSIGITDKNGNEIFVTVYSKGIHKGDYLKVKYLPVSKYGVIEE